MSDFEVPDGIVGSEHLGVRVFCVAAPDPQQLADQIALVLGEHLAADDEMHITYNALETGWQHDPGRAGWLGREPHTQLLVSTPCSSSCEPQLLNLGNEAAAQREPGAVDGRFKPPQSDETRLPSNRRRAGPRPSAGCVLLP